jgi:imidazolonepropionase-like amidohydrolase
LKAARLFDGTSDRPIVPGVVVMSGNRIEAIGGATPANATIVDLGDATLLPGFIDAHTHLTSDFHPDYNGARLRGFSRTVAEDAIRASMNVRKTLLAGFTTVRDVGSQDFLDVGLRDRMERKAPSAPFARASIRSNTAPSSMRKPCA